MLSFWCYYILYYQYLCYNFVFYFVLLCYHFSAIIFCYHFSYFLLSFSLFFLEYMTHSEWRWIWQDDWKFVAGRGTRAWLQPSSLGGLYNGGGGWQHNCNWGGGLSISWMPRRILWQNNLHYHGWILQGIAREIFVPSWAGEGGHRHHQM